MFVTDGQDGRRPNDPIFGQVVEQIKSMPDVQTTFLTVGFSQYHDAVKMNSIAQSRSQQGNFIYVDTAGGDYQDKVTEALGESLDIAIGSDAPIKFRLALPETEVKACPADITYVPRPHDASPVYELEQCGELLLVN